MAGPTVPPIISEKSRIVLTGKNCPKIRNLRLANYINDDGYFDFNKEGLINPNNNLLIVGDVGCVWPFLNNVDIEYYKFRLKDGKIKSMEGLTIAITDCSIATEQELNGKFKNVYVFGNVFGDLFMIGKIRQEDEFNKHALRVFRGFWANGAGILQDANS